MFAALHLNHEEPSGPLVLHSFEVDCTTQTLKLNVQKKIFYLL